MATYVFLLLADIFWQPTTNFSVQSEKMVSHIWSDGWTYAALAFVALLLCIGAVRIGRRYVYCAIEQRQC